LEGLGWMALPLPPPPPPPPLLLLWKVWVGWHVKNISGRALRD